MATVTFSRPMSRMRKAESKEAVFRERKRILKYLVLEFLRGEGFPQSAEAFSREAELKDEFQVCDNVDLDIILQEYTSYYLMRFNKPPVFCKKTETKPSQTTDSASKRRSTAKKRSICEEDSEKIIKCDISLPPFTVTSLGKETVNPDPVTPLEAKPLSIFLSNASSEKKEIASVLYQSIIRRTKVKWDDVKGLDAAKNLLLEAVVYPMRYPGVFTGILEPWKGILLHGPPGTGKTLLAKAVASESNCTFFNVTSSTIVNKWRGESEKIVKTLFELASFYSPSVIFVDELECLASERDAAGEHEASRRLKSQLLTELDGISSLEGQVFLLACSNLPWDIDTAMLRRLEKRIYIPLPDFTSRVAMFREFLHSSNISLDPRVKAEELATLTEGYSGSDIKMVCKEAVMGGVRKILPDLRPKGPEKTRHRVTFHDIETAICKTKPVSKNLTEKHLNWQNNFGSC